MRESNNIFKSLDWSMVLLYSLLVLLGWGNIYAAVYNEEFSSIMDISQKYGKQLLWIAGSFVLIIIILSSDGRIFSTLAYPIYMVSMLSLLGLFIFGKTIAGATSWYAFGSFSLQPSEFAKFATALALAKYATTNGVNLSRLKDRIKAFAIVLLPAILITPQPDPGSALVYTSLILVMYREGLSGKWIFLGISAAVLFFISLVFSTLSISIALLSIAVLFWLILRRSQKIVLKILLVLLPSLGFVQLVDHAFNNVLEDRHRNRINILLGKMEDPKGVGYNTAQSMIAIGSGGFSGKGYLEGTQTKYNFVPEQSTDFIFCTVGEEWGFIGSSFTVLLFTLLLFRIITVAERQKSIFTRVYGYSVASIIFFHFAINIAMTIGLAPVVGIPLPFFSYGGSSLWGFTILLFIFIKLDQYRTQSL